MHIVPGGFSKLCRCDEEIASSSDISRGLGFRALGSGFRFRVQGVGFRVWALGFGVQGLGFRV